MPRKTRKRKEPTQDQQQPYDNLLKSLLEGHEKQVIPYFLREAIYLETLDIETHRTILRVDRVYKILYKGEEHILHLEFESGADDDIDTRLLDYHSYLYRKYGLPVISIIIYPFQTKMAESPLREKSGDREILVFHFSVFPLWKLRAEQYVHDHEILLYALLPTMKGANAVLINKAIDEMIEYYRDNPERLGQEFKWMGIVLRRADTVPLEDKRMIEERLNMHDDLVERDPKMRKMRAESEARGRAEGKAEGVRDSLVKVVKARFPSLTELVQRKVAQITLPDALSTLLDQILIVPDETTARLLLNVFEAQ